MRKFQENFKNSETFWKKFAKKIFKNFNKFSNFEKSFEKIYLKIEKIFKTLKITLQKY